MGRQTEIWPVSDIFIARVSLLPVDRICRYAEEYAAAAPGAHAPGDRLVEMQASGFGRRKKTVSEVIPGAHVLPPMLTAHRLSIT